MMDESYDKSAPPAYADTQGGGQYTEHHATTHATHTETVQLGLNKGYVTTIPGILKIVTAVCSLICVICASIYGGAAAGWGGFVAGTTLFASLLWFFFYLFNIIHRMPVIHIVIEWVYYLVLCICYLIASIVCAALAPAAALLGAYAFFGFVATIALGVDLFLQFKVWRSGGITSTRHTTTTTTTEARY